MNFKLNKGIILTAQFFSEIGDWVAYGAIMLQIYHITHNPLYVSFITISENIAIILASTLGGALADRLFPKQLMIVSDISRAIIICLIPFVATNYWLIYPVLMLLVIFGCFFSPAKMKVIRSVSTDAELASLNGLSFSISGFVKILGFVFGGVIVGLFGYNLPYYIDSGSFLLSALLILFIKYKFDASMLNRETKKEKKSILADIREGFQEIRCIRVVPRLLFIFSIGSLIVGLFVPQLVVYNSALLHGTDLTYGYLNAALAVGMLLSSSLFSKLVNKWEPYKTMTISAFLGIGLILIAMTYAASLPLALIALFVLGCCQTVPNLVGLTLCQTIVPERLLGRFFGLLNVCATAFYVTGMLIGGLAATLSVSWMYRGAGIFAIVIYLFSVLLRKRMKGVVPHTNFNSN